MGYTRPRIPVYLSISTASSRWNAQDGIWKVGGVCFQFIVMHTCTELKANSANLFISLFLKSNCYTIITTYVSVILLRNRL